MPYTPPCLHYRPPETLPICAQESARIQAAGGTVRRLRSSGGTPVGPHRVYGAGNSQSPGLAMSRSLGDGNAHALGVSAVPTFATHHLTPHDQFLVRMRLLSMVTCVGSAS